MLRLPHTMLRVTISKVGTESWRSALVHLCRGDTRATIPCTYTLLHHTPIPNHSVCVCYHYQLCHLISKSVIVNFCYEWCVLVTLDNHGDILLCTSECMCEYASVWVSVPVSLNVLVGVCLCQWVHACVPVSVCVCVSEVHVCWYRTFIPMLMLIFHLFRGRIGAEVPIPFYLQAAR